ncbi:YihY/virulence factor BrkB family protein [Methylobacterium sp. WSM2598]|uniref:YihY/virulence factor BrkB family protein n=1 Tax=Methylobacterium sp. WSM2598 TaxID=398261 RepID=UPI0003604A76|nr:YihY/virulence factor BrkB family protein [Methylobacterium sp. WSM2598]
MSEPVCDAAEPSAISGEGWGSILRRLARSLTGEDIWLRSAGVAFYTLLAAVPALAVPVSVYGLVADPSAVRDPIQMLGGLLPPETSRFLADQMQAVATSSKANLGAGLGGAVLAALWGGRSGASAMVAAVTVAYGEREQRSFLRREQVVLTVGLTTLVFVALAFVLVAFLPLAVAAMEMTREQQTLIRLGRWPGLAALMVLGLGLLYRSAPSRRPAKWRWVSAGAVVATGLWLAGSAGFSFYVERVGSYNHAFGTLGAVMLLLTWLFLSAFVVLLGAELNAELERQTTRDTTEGVERPEGQRGATAADTTA